METSLEKNDSLMDISNEGNSTMDTESNSIKSKKRKIEAVTSPREQRRKQYNDFRRKLRNVLPTVFNKDSERGEYIFNFICDIIRINNLIDADDDITKVDLIITEQRILRALSNLFNMRIYTLEEANKNVNARLINSYISPYKEQFEEKDILGSGGYGAVYKSKHLLDGMDYAVKKILLNGWDIKLISKSLEEVKTLAKLNHVNIVTYKQAWVEPAKTSDIGSLPSSSRSTSASLSYLDIIDSDAAFFRTITKKCKSLSLNTQEPIAESLGYQNESQMVLYIQMSLCDKNLSQWMVGRTDRSSVSVVEKIASQILCGLCFIHSLRIVHHDINPNNIFISEVSGELQVKIGDFGLACVSQKEIHSQEFGTPLYAAPEQMNKKCNPKSDVYGFGITLFQFMVPTQTWMELIKKIDEFKNGIIPNELGPKWVNLIKKSIHENTDLRASAEELLDYLKTNSDIRIANLQSEIDRLKDENSMLHMQIKKHEDEKKLYKNPVAEYNS